MSRSTSRALLKSEYAQFIKEWKRVKRIRVSSGVGSANERRPSMQEWMRARERHGRSPTVDQARDDQTYFPLINAEKDPWGAETDTVGQTSNGQDGAGLEGTQAVSDEGRQA